MQKQERLAHYPTVLGLLIAQLFCRRGSFAEGVLSQKQERHANSPRVLGFLIGLFCKRELSFYSKFSKSPRALLHKGLFPSLGSFARDKCLRALLQKREFARVLGLFCKREILHKTRVSCARALFFCAEATLGSCARDKCLGALLHKTCLGFFSHALWGSFAKELWTLVSRELVRKSPRTSLTRHAFLVLWGSLRAL